MYKRKEYWLNDDITRCVNHECPLRESCKRWLDNPPSDGTKYFYVSKFEPNEDGKCDYQIEKEN